MATYRALPVDSPWPDPCQGAVSLTFDDGMRSQLDVAIPLLEQQHLRGTFYINPRGRDWMERLEPWREVALAGHEIGNHTLKHPCSRNFGWPLQGSGLEGMTLAEIEADIVEADRRIRQAIPEQSQNTFCYPCYQSYVGEGANQQSYVPIVAKYFPAARLRGEVANHPLFADLHYLSSFPAERTSGAEMIGLAELAAATNRWTILTFHGLLEGHLAVGEGDLRMLCEFLATHSERLWVAPVVTVAQRIRAWREGKR